MDELGIEDDLSETFRAHLRSHDEDNLRQGMAQRDDGEEEQDAVVHQWMKCFTSNVRRLFVS